MPKKSFSISIIAIVILTLSTTLFAAVKPISPKVNADTTLINKDSFAPLFKYLITTIRYPKLARINTVTGTVIVSFTLADAKVQDVKIEQKVGSNCEDEVKRVLLAYKDDKNELRPGTYKLAVTFKIPGERTPEPLDQALKMQPNFLNELKVTAFNGAMGSH